MRTTTWLMIAITPLALAACGEQNESGQTTEMPMASQDMPMNEDMPMSDDMPMMESGAEMRMANAEGTVAAIDNEAGTITIDHGPVPTVDWPAMTMAFQADEAQRQQVAVGDEIEFSFRMTGSGSEIISIAAK